MIELIAIELNEKIMNKYGSVYRASKNTGIDTAYFRNVTKRPAWKTLFMLADACGFPLMVSFKEVA